jgi:F-type H+-transporting ATPase subunit c
MVYAFCVLWISFLATFQHMNYPFREELVASFLQLGKTVGAGLATCGLTGAGVGVGVVFGSLVFGLSRNPQEEARLFKYAMLGFALTEAVGLLALMMAFLILFS